MSDEQEKRPYRKKRRAKQEERTRLRLTESAVELHGSLGPAKTSMKAIAEHAGVRRSTLYRHFPDLEAVFDACSAHWSAANPPPDPTPWGEIEDPAERLRVALGELYPYYRRNRRMLENLLRDEDEMAIVKERFAVFHAYLDALREILLAGLPKRGAAHRRAEAAVGHALSLPAWRSLAIDQGLDDAEAAELMVRMLSAAAAR
jgi:AcrR family transcriptional regulator